MDKNEVCRYLKEHNISFEITEHEAVYNMDDLACVKLPYPEADAKNLFIRDDRKQNYCLLTVKGDKRVNLKEFRRRNGLRQLSFASAQELKDILGLDPGAVTPLGLLNDPDCRVRLYLDRYFEGGMIGVHPNDNTATVWLKTDDLIRIIKEHGNAVYVTEI